MKLKKKALIAVLAVALAASVLLAVLPISGNLVVAYLSCIAGAAMLLAGAFAVANRKIPGGRARLYNIAWFFPVSIFISAVVLVLQGADVLVLPYEMQVILQLIPLSIGAVQLLGIGEKKAAAPKEEKAKPAGEEAQKQEAEVPVPEAESVEESSEESAEAAAEESEAQPEAE